MPAISRRRFLSICAATGALGSIPFASFANTEFPLQSWKGIAMGSAASITLSHPDAKNILARATLELDRLENIFSLYRPHSTLSQLNRIGSIDAPPFELLECLGLCGAVHQASDGLFDPTVQSLWQLYAESYAKGHAPQPPKIDQILKRTGWQHVRASADHVSFNIPAMAITLNGIAQGYVADRIASLLRNEGLTSVLINTGEFSAIGGHPEGSPWAVSIDRGTGLKKDAVMLRDNALATSLPNGTFFDQDGLVGHILDPRTGMPARARRHSISVTAPKAALADALSTAMCLASDAEIETLLQRFPTAKRV